MRFLLISTPNHGMYIVNSDGLLTKNTGNTPEFSGGWKMLGLEPTFKSGKKYIPFEDITPELLKEIKKDLSFKTSGNPKYTVRDLDHGTVRVWGNTKYHGVYNINFIER